MSDIFEVRKKAEEGASWRGEINVAIDGEQHELTVRQLRDPEFWEVMSMVDTDELKELQGEVPEEKMEEFRDLQQADDLDDDEEERLEKLQNEIEEEDIDLFEALSYETYQGIKKCAVYGVEPDESDIQRALSEHAGEIEDSYGGLSRENAEEYLNDHMIRPMMDDFTDFTSFTIGVKVFGETLDDSGN